jgi:hypothetical protein
MGPTLQSMAMIPRKFSVCERKRDRDWSWEREREIGLEGERETETERHTQKKYIALLHLCCIDEIDGYWKGKEEEQQVREGREWWEKKQQTTINQLLTEMDGSGVCVLHREWEWSVEHMCNNREQRNSFPLDFVGVLRANVREWNVLVGGCVSTRISFSWWASTRMCYSSYWVFLIDKLHS